MKTENKSRYTVTLEFYIYAKDDEEAIKLAQKIEDNQRRKYDNQAIVTEIYHTPFGTLSTRRIK